MIGARTPILVALLLGLAACADPAVQWLGGVGDPVRGAALSAPSMLGNTAKLAGRPATAARAAVQLEVLDDAFSNDPRWAPEAGIAVLHATRLGRAEMRQAIGIAPLAPPDLVMSSLRDAADSLDAGSSVRAEAALTGPAFPLGGQVTLARLNSLPRLPRVSEAAGAANAEISRRDGGLRR